MEAAAVTALETALAEDQAFQVRYAEALAGVSRLSIPCAVGWVRPTPETSDAYRLAARIALTKLSESMGERAPSDFDLRRTPLGQPLLEAGVADLHVSFTHDGEAHLAMAARRADLVGIGIDVVHLPRLRSPQKNEAYLRRFARHFMGPDEYASYIAASTEDNLEGLMVRTAAHFSLMEAASKALGTGLKIGGGMGHEDSLPKQSLGLTALTPTPEFLLDARATARIEELCASRMAGHWGHDPEYLVSAVALYR